MPTIREKGSGSIYYDERSGKWFSELSWKDKNGVKKNKKFSSDKRITVKNKLDDFKKKLAIDNGNFDGDNVLFEDFAIHWMNSLMVNKLKPSSFSRKEVTLTHQVYPFIGKIPINKITHADVQNMVNSLNEQGLSYSTIKKAYEAVAGCLKEYRIKNGVMFNPCEGITLPSNRQKDISNITFFDEDQREAIKQEATRKYKNGESVYRLGNAIIFLMYTGLRIGELLALTWDDVDWDKRLLTVNKNAVVVKQKSGSVSHYKLINQNSTKTKSGNRIVPLSEIAMNSLREIQKINGDQKYVMSSSNGKQVTPRNINRMFHSILRETGIASSSENLCGVHALRHTFASMLFKNGCNVKVVSELLGHTDTKITENIYIHVIQQQKVQAINDIDKYSK